MATLFIACVPRETEGGIVNISADLPGLVGKAPDLGSKKKKYNNPKNRNKNKN